MRAYKIFAFWFLLGLAVTLDDVPPSEQIVLGVALFYFSWEDTSGLPSQVLMQAEKRKLVEVQTGRADADSVRRIMARSDDGPRRWQPVSGAFPG